MSSRTASECDVREIPAPVEPLSTRRRDPDPALSFVTAGAAHAPERSSPYSTESGNACDPGALEAIAQRSRCRFAAARQQPRRLREQAARHQAAAFADSARGQGMSYQRAARYLKLPRRTLLHWSRRRLDPVAWRPRGRRCKESSTGERLAVLELLDRSGPRLGLPTLRRLFPQMPRCELSELEADYRRQFRCEHRVNQETLRWLQPRRVWAMDHSRPPGPIDGRHPSIFAVRDLASGLQLAWLPVPDEAEDTTAGALQRLFHEFGAPLVLKSDNGPAFKSQRLHELLAAWDVVPLFSPPRTPRYNGACEAANHALKVRTWQQAEFSGHPAHWTSADLAVARHHTNELHVPSEKCPFTAHELWTCQTPIGHNERQTFLSTVARIGHELCLLPTTDPSLPQAPDPPFLQRRVLRRALVELGLLSVTRRSISLPINRRKMAKIL